MATDDHRALIADRDDATGGGYRRDELWDNYGDELRSFRDNRGRSIPRRRGCCARADGSGRTPVPLPGAAEGPVAGARPRSAAARVFARQGLHGASVEAVSEEAGFSRGALYSNFESKEDLFLALYKERIGRRRRELREVGDGPVRGGMSGGSPRPPRRVSATPAVRCSGTRIEHRVLRLGPTR